MRIKDQKLFNELVEILTSFSENEIELSGILNQDAKFCFIQQLIDSVRRINYVTTLRNKAISNETLYPTDSYFNPIKAAIVNHKNGNIDEAFWLVFLITHFSRHRLKGWNLLRGIYSGMTNNIIWSWDNITNNFEEFRSWLNNSQEHLKEIGGFGNHRKYESLGAYNQAGTGSVIYSYLSWIGRSHNEKIYEIFKPEATKRENFEYFYSSMKSVHRFGRTARFDYLCMIGKMGFLEIEPPSAYLRESTGPIVGVKRLIGVDNLQMKEYEEILESLEAAIGQNFGMQVLEDALCNWQKSPVRYKFFNG